MQFLKRYPFSPFKSIHAVASAVAVYSGGANRRTTKRRNEIKVGRGKNEDVPLGAEVIRRPGGSRGRDDASMVNNEHLKYTAALPLYISLENAISRTNFSELLVPLFYEIHIFGFPCCRRELRRKGVKVDLEWGQVGDLRKARQQLWRDSSAGAVILKFTITFKMLFVSYVRRSAKILILNKEGIIENISYDRRAYESVDEKSLS